jgi:hypothetical protein
LWNFLSFGILTLRIEIKSILKNSINLYSFLCTLLNLFKSKYLGCLY